jgi:hypothetical protein
MRGQIGSSFGDKAHVSVGDRIPPDPPGVLSLGKPGVRIVRRPFLLRKALTPPGSKSRPASYRGSG